MVYGLVKKRAVILGKAGKSEDYGRRDAIVQIGRNL
jgi:hypothetical protein